ncbi:DUF1775 domain-containing protein [Nitriliruptoraceae bacterium ZYF776]|nr:DUF1775 domain-containing protein [Profundirhabdus halotolerans]
MRPRRVLTTVALAGVASLVLATPAAAHPFFRDADQVPANSLTTLTLAMAHGCQSESAGEGDPTLEVAVEVHERFSYVEPIDEDGYEASVETDDDGNPTTLVWTATGDGEPAPDVEFDVVVDGEPGDEVYVSVFQGCADFEYRWIGTPDEPADDPAVRLVLTDEDPDSPPPVEEEAPTDDAPATDADDGDLAEEDATDGDAEVDEAPVDEVESPEEPAEPETEEAADEGGFPWVPLVVVLVVVAVIGAVLAARTRRGGPGAGTDAGAAS